MSLFNKVDWLSLMDSHPSDAHTLFLQVLISILIASYPVKADCTNT